MAQEATRCWKIGQKADNYQPNEYSAGVLMCISLHQHIGGTIRSAHPINDHFSTMLKTSLTSTAITTNSSGGQIVVSWICGLRSSANHSKIYPGDISA